MSVLFIGKRFYTNRDALREKYGRIFQLPWHWAEAGIPTRLWLVDYHTRESVHLQERQLEIGSTPVRNLSVLRRWRAETHGASGKPDVVVASGDCYIGLMSYWIARGLRARFVFDVYDKYDEFGGYRRLPGFDPFGFLLRRADARLFASRALMSTTGYIHPGNTYVPNGIDTKHFHPMDKHQARQELGLVQDALYVGYFGTLDADRGARDLIEAVCSLREQGSPVQLLLGGHLLDKSLPLDGCGVHYLGNLPYERVPQALASCDLLALPYRSTSYLDFASSCKIAEYIACRRPIVATRTPNLVANFPAQAEKLGSLLATPGDATDIARVIREQAACPVLVDMPDEMDWTSISMTVANKLSLHQEPNE